MRTLRAVVVIFVSATLLLACEQQQSGSGQDRTKADTGGCRPTCDKIGTRSEGWHDGCTGKLIGYANCAGCEAQCDKIGSDSEGWYSQGSVAECATAGKNGGNLIRFDACGTAQPSDCPSCEALCIWNQYADEGVTVPEVPAGCPMPKCACDTLTVKECPGCEELCIWNRDDTFLPELPPSCPNLKCGCN